MTNGKRLQGVIDIQKDFEYHRFQVGDYTIYRCGRPKSNTYAFEIIIGTMGIYVGGDIGTLVFRVARDLGFLAGDDIDYYIHSKLDHDFLDKKELSEDLLKEYLAQVLRDACDDFKPEDEDFEPPEDFNSLIDFYKKNGLDRSCWEIIEEPKNYNKAWDLYEKLRGTCDLNEAYNAIHESSLYDGDMPCLGKTAENIMFRLYMVNHAAKKILKQESEARAKGELNNATS